MKLKKLISVLCCLVIGGTFVACNDRTPNGDGGKGPDHSGQNKPNDDGQIPDDNNVTVTDPDDTEHSFALISQSGGVLKFKCADCGDEETVTVTCVSGTANAYSVDGTTITFGNVTEKSVYDISGSLHGDIVIDAGDDNKFELQMSGLTVNSKERPISIFSGDKVTLSAKKSTENYIYDLRAAVDTTDGNAVSASVYADCDLDIQGKGSLTVKSVNNNGIHTKKDLNVKNLDLQVDCMDNALKGNDSVTIEAGNVVLISRQGDGIKTTNSDMSKKGNQRGTVAISGGDVLIYAASDGIDAAYDVNIDQSTADTTLQIFTDKYSKYSEEVTATADGTYYVRFNSTAYKYSLKFYNDDEDAVWHNSSSATTVGNYRYYSITKPSGYSYVKLYIYNSTQQQGQDEDYVACTEGMTVNNNYDTIALQSRGSSLSYGWTNYTTAGQGGRPNGGFGGPMGGMNDGNTDKGDHSTKGIKAGNSVTVAAGNITVSAYDDAIHASNDTALENGETPLGNLAISGGELTVRSNDDGLHADNNVSISGGSVNIVSSYEGIEGTTVEISGGDVTVKSTDDGINGTAKSGASITISGGKLYVLASGDGVDSNSQTNYEGIHFSGGRSVIISTGQADSGIDTERGYKYSGGYVVALSKSGGMGNESTKCQNFSSVGTSKTVSLQKDGFLTVDGIATIKMPASLNALVVCLGKTNASISSGTTAGGTMDSNGVWWNV